MNAIYTWVSRVLLILALAGTALISAGTVKCYQALFAEDKVSDYIRTINDEIKLYDTDALYRRLEKYGFIGSLEIRRKNGDYYEVLKDYVGPLRHNDFVLVTAKKKDCVIQKSRIIRIND